MTHRTTFGRRRPVDLTTPYKVRPGDGDDPPRRRWGWGWAVLAIVGGVLVIGAGWGRTDAPEAAVAAAAPAPVVQRPEPCVATLKEYLALTPGMSPSQAASIIGCPGTEVTRVSFEGLDSVILSWEGNDFIANMNATFDDGRLTAKTQLGLK